MTDPTTPTDGIREHATQAASLLRGVVERGAGGETETVELDLEAIQGRRARYAEIQRVRLLYVPNSETETSLLVAAAISADDVPALIAEVERLRADLAIAGTSRIVAKKRAAEMEAEVLRLRRELAPRAIAEFLGGDDEVPA